MKTPTLPVPVAGFRLMIHSDKILDVIDVIIPVCLPAGQAPDLELMTQDQINAWTYDEHGEPVNPVEPE